MYLVMFIYEIYIYIYYECLLYLLFFINIFHKYSKVLIVVISELWVCLLNNFHLIYFLHYMYTNNTLTQYKYTTYILIIKCYCV